MATVFRAGGIALPALCRALGIDPDAQHVLRIVIDVSYQDIAKVYIQRALDVSEEEAAAAALADADKEVIPAALIDVDEKGNVVAVPEDLGRDWYAEAIAVGREAAHRRETQPP